MKLISGVEEVNNFFGVKIFLIIESNIIPLYYMPNFTNIGLIVLKLEQFEILVCCKKGIFQLIVS